MTARRDYITTKDSVIKQLGSNDFAHLVYTSKVETECSPMIHGNPQGCILKCAETTKLYEGDVLIRKSSNSFSEECPDVTNGIRSGEPNENNSYHIFLAHNEVQNDGDYHDDLEYYDDHYKLDVIDGNEGGRI